MKKKYLQRLLEHHSGYINRYVSIPSEQGFFIEAFCRLDSLLDDIIIDLLVHKNQKSEATIYGLRMKGALVPTHVAEFLMEQKVIDKKTLSELYKFKNYRNIAAHRVHGDLELAYNSLKETGFYDKPGVCFDCAECMQKHLASIGYKSLDEYSKVALKKRVSIGLGVYNQLIAALKSKKQAH